MNKTIEALKLAEWALLTTQNALLFSAAGSDKSMYVEAINDADKALAAIREALAEPVKQEPIAWEATSAGVIKFVTDSRYKKFSQNIQQYYKPYRCSHCSEPVKQEPVEQEPVAWGWVMDGEVNDCIGPTEHARCEGEYQVPLYAAPVDAKAIQEENEWLRKQLSDVYNEMKKLQSDAKVIRAEALDEAAKVCEQDEFQIYETAERCAAAIRGLK